MEKKYQYSKFLGENREEQVVIRADNWEEFKEAAFNIGIKVENIAGEEKADSYQVRRTTQTPNETEKPQSVIEYQKSCPQCGAEKVLNPKTGKWFCKDKCWLKPV